MAKPLFERTGPAPRRIRWWHRAILGLLPGARLVALNSFQLGLPYLILGAGTLVAIIWCSMSWNYVAADLDMLHIEPRWFLLHAGALYSTVLTYELLRLGSAIEERPRSVRGPRTLNAFIIPALVALFTIPPLVPLWPRLMEALWFAAGVTVLGGWPASAWVLFESRLHTKAHHRRFQKVCLFAYVALAIALLVLLLNGASIAAWAHMHGFRVLPWIFGG